MPAVPRWLLFNGGGDSKVWEHYEAANIMNTTTFPSSIFFFQPSNAAGIIKNKLNLETIFSSASDNVTKTWMLSWTCPQFYMSVKQLVETDQLKTCFLSVPLRSKSGSSFHCSKQETHTKSTTPKRFWFLFSFHNIFIEFVSQF